jgi:hypothetical protein
MSKIADKLDELAERMQKEIDYARRPMTQNPTPKRMRQYNSRVHDGNNWERGQRALRALADAHRAGTVPEILVGLKTKAEILPLVRKGLKCGGYYDCIPDDAYSDKGPVATAVQALIDRRSPGQLAADARREQQEKIGRMEDRLRFADIPGFFPTPAKLVKIMLDLADIRPGMRVLEPSAGKGDIAEEIRARHPGGFLDVLEVNYSLVEILGAKGFNVHRYDFLEWPAPHLDGRRGYDRIVMNPPFENLQDVAHVTRAYDLLAPGGRVVAIMSCSPFVNSKRRGEEFRQWLGLIAVLALIVAGLWLSNAGAEQKKWDSIEAAARAVRPR